MLYSDLIFIVIFGLYLYWVWGLIRALKSDAPYVPMRPDIVRALVGMVKTKPGSLWVDLGSGDGRVLIEAYRQHNIVGRGVERIGALRWLSRACILAWRAQAKIRIQGKDFFKTDLSQADVVSFYLMPKTTKRIIEKLRTELKPGAQIVYYRFPITGVRLADEDAERKLYRAVAPF